MPSRLYPSDTTVFPLSVTTACSLDLSCGPYGCPALLGTQCVGQARTDSCAPCAQACIDENLEVVRFLVEQGATVNQADNEGWTPLHVAASCGYLDIAR